MPPHSNEGKNKKTQVAIDFLSSYGIALLIVAIAIFIAYKVSAATAYTFSSQCTAIPGFSCGYYSLTQNGVLTTTLSQGIGATINIKGAACSTLATVNALPAYGNLYVTNSINYYPPGNSPGTGIIVQSSSTTSIAVYCYGPNGIATRSTPGGQYVGYVWLNYTIQNTKINNTQQVASIALQYIVAPH